MCQIVVADGLAALLKSEIPRWGSILDAFLHWTSDDKGEHLISVVADTAKDDLFERDFAHCRTNGGTHVTVPDYVPIMVEKVAAITGWSEKDAATLIFDVLRTLIRTSEDLGYEY